jgi:hypothetical protein
VALGIGFEEDVINFAYAKREENASRSGGKEEAFRLNP